MEKSTEENEDVDMGPILDSWDIESLIECHSIKQGNLPLFI